MGHPQIENEFSFPELYSAEEVSRPPVNLGPQIAKAHGVTSPQRDFV
jgi:hypothetical protein